MSSFILTKTRLEALPDEILLLICEYLSSTEILFSFVGLNSRLSKTISGFCRHVVLAQIPFKRFNYICKTILPQIGTQISSLVVSNDWKGVLSKIFLNYFGEKMSSIFPCLKQLILPTYLIDSLASFLDCLQNLPLLFEIKIMSVYEMGTSSTSQQALLEKLFTANNNRLTSILFDDDSLSFSYKNNTDVNYLHIENLVIELDCLSDLHRLLTDLPQLKSIDVAINGEDLEIDEDIKYIPIVTLKYFRLRSFIQSWKLADLVTIFRRIPNIEELIIQINTHYDTRLIDGEQMYSHLSSLLSLKKFTYFLQFQDISLVDTTDVISSWKEFQQDFICINSDDNESIILYSLPFNYPYLTLRYSLAKNKNFSDNFGYEVKCLTLYEVSTRIAETFSIINKCHRMQRLILQIYPEIIPESFQEIQLRKLPYLTFFVAFQTLSINTDDFKRLLEAAPNLYHMAIAYELLDSLFASDIVCNLLGRRVTDLLIGITSEINSEAIPIFITRLASVCPSLKHLYFHSKDSKNSTESIILTVLNHLSKWNCLISFGVANIKIDSKILTQGIREWIIENSNLHDNDSFLTDYSADTFRLWL
ncbi:unnamed protein product [Adineta steineri]|uniref:F-box domain-containing protein n=1 Tax=Adineta steineri TaxID=433720 RepID=A0A814M5P2_9BILA|nr:unnamed protein product [Adineta steineri]CAF1141181.1 unnamed protein product [Adineta steineri]